MEQEIRFCRSADGTRIAYAVAGAGPPIVIVPPWVTHLEILWAVPEYRARMEELGQRFTVVRIEKRGNGLSDRDCGDFSLDARLADLEAVIDELKLKRLALLGYSEGGPTSIAYAAKYPRRVTRMVLDGTWARGAAMLGGKELQDAVMGLVQAEWGISAGMLTDLFMGADAAPHMRAAFVQMQQIGCSKQDAYNSMIANFAMDIRDLLPKVRCPTLVVHARGDRIVPLELGRELAAGIRGARFVSREGSHVPTDAAQMAELDRIIDEFLDEELPASARHTPATAAADERALHTVLFTDMESSTASTQRLGDAGAQALVHIHNEIVRESLGAHGGREIKHTGDGIMASFASATRAVDCAIAIQRACAAREGAARVRVGLNAGEPIAEDGDLFGTTVQLARRVCDAGAPGEIVVSNVVRELCAGKPYLFGDRGVAPLKGFDDPVRLFEVRWQE